MGEVSSDQSGQGKILLVEDDDFIWRAYKDGLERAGYEVEVATEGEGVVEKAKKFKPDLILLDLILPGMDGFEVLESLKKDAELKKLKVMVVSNLGQPGDMKKAMELGAVDYLVKTNTSMKGVVEKIKSLLGKKG